MELQPINLEDAEKGWHLTQAVGWGHTTADWARLLRLGFGYGVFVGDQLVASGIAVTYGQARAWINMVLTHPDYQRRGLSTLIMNELLHKLEKRGVAEIWLDASNAGRPVYERLGFRDMGQVELWSGAAQSFPVEVATIQPEQLAQVIAYDAAVFGVPRPALITDWVQEVPDKCFADGAHGLILARQGSPEWAAIGCWQHDTPAGAETLFRAALTQLAGTVTAYVPEHNPYARPILENYGFTYLRHCTRMIYGDVTPRPTDWTRYYSAATFALG